MKKGERSNKSCFLVSGGVSVITYFRGFEEKL